MFSHGNLFLKKWVLVKVYVAVCAEELIKALQGFF